MTESVDVAALAARLERLETVEAARSALYRYAEGADTRDWAVLGSAFAEDAVLSMGGVDVSGRTAIVDSLRGMLPPEFVTKHLIVNPQVTWLSPGSARVRATVYYLHEGTGFEATGWGEYLDEVLVHDGVGQITRKSFTPGAHLPGSVARVATMVDGLTAAELGRAATWRYADAVDSLDFDLLADSFTEDASLTTRRGTRHGRDAIVEYYRTALADPVDRKHLLMNQKVTPDVHGQVVVASSFLYTYAGPDTSVIGWGTYEDRVRIDDGVGRIAAKTIGINVHADSRIGWAGEITP